MIRKRYNQIPHPAILRLNFFSKHSAYASLNLHKYFDDAFADAFLDVAHGRSRIEVADNDMFKHSSIGEKIKKRTEYNEMYKKK